MNEIDFHPPTFSWLRVFRWSAVGTAAMLILMLPASGPDTAGSDTRRASSDRSSGDVPVTLDDLRRAVPGLRQPGITSLSNADRFSSARGSAASNMCARQAEKLALDMSDTEKSKVMNRVFNVLAGSGDARVRVAGLMLEATLRRTSAMTSAVDDVSRECVSQDKDAKPTPACEKAQAALARANTEDGRGGTSQVEQIARIAAHSNDPLVYAVGVQACTMDAKAPLAPSCGMVSLDQWARLDPHNGVVWIQVIEEAHAKGDRQAVDAALHRLSQAQTSDYYAFSVASLALRNLPADLSAREKNVASIRGSMVWAQWNLPGYGALVKECSEPSIRDANRAQTCESIAKLMTTREKSAMGVIIGARIGEKLGWPPERVEDIRTEVRLSLAAGPDVPMDDDKTTAIDCDWPRQLSDWMSLVGERGEMGAGRELARRSGRSVAQLKAEYAAKQAAAAAAASAASSAAPR